MRTHFLGRDFKDSEVFNQEKPHQYNLMQCQIFNFTALMIYMQELKTNM